MKIKVLGSGCKKCTKLYDATLNVIKAEGYEAEVEKEEDIVKIMEYGVMSTPALVINEKVVVSGKVPKESEIKKHISDNM